MNVSCSFQFRIEKRRYASGFYFNYSKIKKNTSPGKDEVFTEVKKVSNNVEIKFPNQLAEENILTPSYSLADSISIQSKNNNLPISEQTAQKKEIESYSEKPPMVKYLHSLGLQFGTSMVILGVAFIPILFQLTTWFLVGVTIGILLTLFLRKLIHQTIMGEREMKYPGFYLILSWIYGIGFIFLALYMLTLSLEIIWPIILLGIVGLSLFIIAPISLYGYDEGRLDYKNTKTLTYIFTGIAAIVTSLIALF